MMPYVRIIAEHPWGDLTPRDQQMREQKRLPGSLRLASRFAGISSEMSIFPSQGCCGRIKELFLGRWSRSTKILVRILMKTLSHGWSEK